MTLVAAKRDKRLGWGVKSIIKSPFAFATIHASFLLTADVVAASVAAGAAFVVAGYISSTIVGSDYVSFSRAIADRMPVASPLLLICALWLNSRGHYLDRIPFWTEVKDLVSVATLGLIAEGFIQYAVKVHISRLWIVGFWFLLVPLVVAMRASIKWLLTNLSIRRLDVFLFGEAESFLGAVKAEKLLGYVLVGSSKSSSPETAAAMVRGSGAKLAIIAVGGMTDASAAGIANSLSQAGIRFALCPPLAGLGLASMRPLVLFGHNAMLLVERQGLANPVARMIKRLIDIIAAIMGILICGPIALVFAMAVRLDGGPALYAQRRIGRDGRTIRVWKLRSMVVDSDAQLHRILAGDPLTKEEWERDRKLKDDPRITRLGRFMRTIAVDEVPQLWNILTGDMSFVGPRPVVADEIGRYGDVAGIYLGVRPGLTGLWQVSGRNDTSFERRVELDAWYVRNWSLWVDAVVMMKTLPAIATRRGAY